MSYVVVLVIGILIGHYWSAIVAKVGTFIKK